MAGKKQEMYDEQLLQLQEIDFVLLELNLYLDTHPGDIQAIQQYNQLAMKRKQMQMEFEAAYGPLLHYGQSYTKYPFQWIESPWPWQV
ncbi:spore coat protein CotJB [Longirhabdus pacifica]|uniref:spore coat protein CotJB n=1 Tax=Longirhabdus pacifica TaxID=2305227 RepID=UPI0010090107|nr:spore coat protein CotJB [Longirhabdus pacifica]